MFLGRFITILLPSKDRAFYHLKTLPVFASQFVLPSSGSRAWAKEKCRASDLQSVSGNLRSILLGKHSLATEMSKNSLGTKPLLTTTNTCARTRFLKANNNLRFGFRNVRTMSQLFKTEQSLQEKQRYHLDILALSEVR